MTNPNKIASLVEKFMLHNDVFTLTEISQERYDDVIQSVGDHNIFDHTQSTDENGEATHTLSIYALRLPQGETRPTQQQIDDATPVDFLVPDGPYLRKPTAQELQRYNDLNSARSKIAAASGLTPQEMAAIGI